MSNNLYWKVTSEAKMVAEYREKHVVEVFRPVYQNSSRLWRAKKGWFISVPLYLVIENKDDGDNCAGLHFIDGKYPLSVISGRNKDRTNILSGLSACLAKIGVDKKVFFDSLKAINLSDKEKPTLEKLLDLLEPKKTVESPKPRK